MAAILVVEDGTGVTSANCYGDTDLIEAYADARNITIPQNDDTVAQGAILAMDYIESRKRAYKGLPTYVPGLSWPRGGIIDYEPQYNPAYFTGLELEGFAGLGFFDGWYVNTGWYGGYWNQILPSNVIPAEIISIYCYLACQAANGVSLMPDQSQPFLQQQSIGQAGLVQIWNADKITPQPKFILVDRMLRPFMKEESALRSRRA